VRRAGGLNCAAAARAALAPRKKSVGQSCPYVCSVHVEPVCPRCTYRKEMTAAWLLHVPCRQDAAGGVDMSRRPRSFA
jgi:hypothetical protein